MIKLKILLNEIKSPYIIVGCVDDDFNIIMDSNIESHSDLLDKYGWSYNRDKYNFRYNASNQTIYWYNQPSEDIREEVKALIKKRFPYYHVTKTNSISSNDKLNYQKLQMKAHGLSENIKGKLTVYHGTKEPFKTFNIKKSTHGIVWFTSNKEKIVKGESGANSKGYIITAIVTLNNPAGWDEYEKMSLGELKRDGYDGAILPDGGSDGSFDCFVFFNTQIKIVGIEKDEFKPKSLSEITDLERDEMYPEDSDKWDDWQEYLDHFDYECPKSEISKLKNRFDLEYSSYFNQKIIKLYDLKNNIIWLEYNKENESFDVIKNIIDWTYSNDAEQVVNISADDIYNGHLETTLKEFKSNPSPVYHYTTEENWELIKQDGELVGSGGTGINNRSAHGIFTSVNPEEYQNGTYGNICLEINLPAFKSELKIPELNLEYEPQVAEHLVREYISYELELGEIPSDYHSEGISPYTIIVGYKMPLKFIKQI